MNKFESQLANLFFFFSFARKNLLIMKSLIVIFVFFSLSLKSQDFKTIEKLTIKSKAEKITRSLDGSPTIEKGKDIGNIKTEIVTLNSSSEHVVHREMKITNEIDKVLIQLKIKRILHKNVNLFDIDTDSPFSSDERNKQITDHYLQFIEQPLKMTVDLKSDSLIIQNTKLPILGLWGLGIPKLNKVLAFSGIFLDPKYFEKQSWNDTLVNGKSTYYNSCRIINRRDSVLEIEISGFAKNTSSVSSNSGSDSSPKIPNAGEKIIAETSNLLEKYSGTCLVDKESGLITDMTLKVAKDEILKAMGQAIQKTTESIYKVSNKKN